MTERAELAGATPPGRPKDREKRLAIMESAKRLFMEQGLGAVTMEGVAAAAGVSKVTVYGHFGDKAGLFEAVVRDRTAAMAAALAELETSGTRLAEALPQFGQQLLTFLTRPEMVAFERMLSSEAHRHPDLARRFFEAGPGRMCRALARVIEAGHRRREVAVDEPYRAAQDFVMLMMGTWQIELRLGLMPSPGPGEISARVRRAVTLFMRAHAAR